MSLWKKLLEEEEDGWKKLKRELSGYMGEELGLTYSQIEEFFDLDYRLRKDLGLFGKKDETNKSDDA